MERVFEIVNIHGEKVRTTALNQLHVDAFLKEGFTEVTEEDKKKK